jgi:hypothetical protein
MKIKLRIGMLTGCLLAANLLTATCTINPLDYTGRVVSGAFGNDLDESNSRNSLAMFRGIIGPNGENIAILDVYKYGGSLWTPWSATYDVSKITDRVVSGDFDNDGSIDDIAAISDDGSSNTSIDVWSVFNTVVGNSVTFYDNMWTSTTYGAHSYDATKITGRVVSGDFDSDGFYDDIAAFYDYGGGVTKLHVWLRNNSGGFTYVWRWETSGYSCSQITGRVVSGDFDRDGKCDDIAALYDYGGGAARLHVFTGNGASSSFTYSNGADGWWSVASGYTPSNITFRVVSGNFDRSGFPLNHKNDDIVAIYDYGSGVAKAHVWTSTGGSFNYNWKWEVSGFNAANITDRFVSFDTDPNRDATKTFGMAALYNYGTSTDVAYHWQASSGGSWNFTSSTGPFCPHRLSADVVSADATEMTPALSVNAFPNPGDGHITVEIAPTAEGMASLMILDLSGREVYSKTVNIAAGYREEIDLTSFGKGMYILQVIGAGGTTVTKRLIIQ